jgi:hypothetical protein
VTLEIAKQGAIYHGLATLLSQPSPVMTRGKGLVYIRRFCVLSTQIVRNEISVQVNVITERVVCLLSLMLTKQGRVGTYLQIHSIIKLITFI